MIRISRSQVAIIVFAKSVMLKLMTSALISMNVKLKNLVTSSAKNVLILLVVIDAFVPRDSIELTPFASMSTNVNYPSQGPPDSF